MGSLFEERVAGSPHACGWKPALHQDLQIGPETRYSIPRTMDEIRSKFMGDSKCWYYLRFVETEFEFVAAAIKFFIPYQGRRVGDLVSTFYEFLEAYFQVYNPYESPQIFFRFHKPEEVAHLLRRLVL